MFVCMASIRLTSSAVLGAALAAKSYKRRCIAVHSRFMSRKGARARETKQYQKGQILLSWGVGSSEATPKLNFKSREVAKRRRVLRDKRPCKVAAVPV